MRPKEFDCWIQFPDDSFHTGRIDGETLKAIHEAQQGKNEGKWEGRIVLSKINRAYAINDRIAIKDILVVQVSGLGGENGPKSNRS